MDLSYLATVLLCTLYITCAFQAQTKKLRIIGRSRTQQGVTPMTKAGLAGVSLDRYMQRQRQQYIPSRLYSTKDSDYSSVEPTWTCLMSTNQDLDAAVAEAIEGIDGSHEYNLAIFYVSSIYEASSFKYDTIFKQLKEKFPSIKVVLGSTTGAVIGPTSPFAEPVELEARAGFSLTLGKLDDDVDIASFALTKEQMIEYIKDDRVRVRADHGAEPAPVMLFTTEQCKVYLSDFMNQLESREGGEAFGAIASSVTSLHQPKVFVASGNVGEAWEKFTAGTVGLVLSGNIEVKTLSARSCLPVGPVYEVRERDGKEIMTLVPAGGTLNDRLSPLEALDHVIKSIPSDYSEALKRDLLVGAVPDDLQDDEKVTDRIFFGQKPLAFDPISGSITLSSVPGGNAASKMLFRFCIRDVVTSQNDLQTSISKARALVRGNPGDSAPLACMLLGSMDRGNKMFKYASWEASQLYNALEETSLSRKVPIFGMFSLSSFGKVAVGEDGTPAADRVVSSIMEADSVYAFLTKKGNTHSGAATTATAATAAPASKPDTSGGTSRDLCSTFELTKFNDEEDQVIVEKRDPESAAPVRVATMDYLIPEKAPQPSNVLESMVWDREQAVDRMRERFQLSKALMQATRSELKYPARKLSDALAVTREEGRVEEEEFTAEGALTLLVEFNRNTLHNGKISEESLGDSDVSRLAGAKAQVHKFSESIQKLMATEGDLLDKGLSLAAVGAHADAGTFRGSYEDVESLRESDTGKTFPVLCNDFVLYAYQLFKAKSSGADAVKLHASILPSNEISYMAKIAKKINLGIVVVVSSIPQLLDVVDKVQELEILSISSRNMRLWKIAKGKSGKILQNEEVRAAIALRRMVDPAGVAGKSRLVVVCEGISTSEDIVALREDPLVDGVLLGEELVGMQLPVDEAVTLLVNVE